jgi:hypothetical protein
MSGRHDSATRRTARPKTGSGNGGRYCRAPSSNTHGTRLRIAGANSTAAPPGSGSGRAVPVTTAISCPLSINASASRCTCDSMPPVVGGKKSLTRRIRTLHVFQVVGTWGVSCPVARRGRLGSNVCRLRSRFTAATAEPSQYMPNVASDKGRLGTKTNSGCIETCSDQRIFAVSGPVERFTKR